MASRPLWNGTARLSVDNNLAEPLLNRYTFRARVGAAPDPANEAIDNTTFQAKAGVPITIHYDIRKFGSGAATDSPTRADLQIIDDTGGTASFSPDLIAGGNLPLTGTYVFTPSRAGTFWIKLILTRVSGVVQQWQADNDGFEQFTVGTISRRFHIDKGRLRAGWGVNTFTVTERTNAAPPTFGVTMNAARTATEEAVRYNVVLSHGPFVAAVLSIRNRRNGTETLDAVAAPSLVPGAGAFPVTQDFKVNQLNYPTMASQLYDAVLFIATNSTIHTSNTPQYSGLADPASASGVWTHFTDVGAGLTLESFQSVARLASHTVNSLVTIDNTFADFSDEYAEDANGFPTGTENIEYVATDKNMTIKVVGIKNARGEALGGIFVVTSVIHEASGAVRDTWGLDNSTYRTNAFGHQSAPKVVQVATPPGGLHKIDASAYFPSGSFAVPAARELLATRIEQGSPGAPPTDTSKGKNWIAAASFYVAVIVSRVNVKGGVVVPFIAHIRSKDAEVNSDDLPTFKVYKNGVGNEVPNFASGTMAKRAGTTGLYDASFVPDVVTPGNIDVYELAISAAVGGFPKTHGIVIMAVSYDAAAVGKHTHPASLIGMPGPPVL